jgi:L-alanine-DL-glutamate epimerase-like enolase superfamily enzyme
MSTLAREVAAPVAVVEATAYTIPTDHPESDGTASWDSTTLVVVEISAGGQHGLGYTYADTATARLINDKLAGVVTGRDAFAIPAAWVAMVTAVRNLGRPGIAAMAISCVDNALWDLKAKLLDLPLVTLLGAARDAAPVYGSGGFTSYPIERLRDQLAGWVNQGIPRVKMKIGTHPGDDLERVRAARDAIGASAALFVDANGAYSCKQALEFAERFAELGVSWFEEPVSSDDLDVLRLIRDRAPAGMDVAAGEYGYDPYYFERMLNAGAVDVPQADATRCLGITGFLRAAALADAHHLPLSAHCAPSLHAHPACAVTKFRHLEYFHDHVRIEHMLFDGALTPVDGALHPDLSRPGLGLEFKRRDAERYAAD